MTSKADLEALMLPEIDDIIEEWDEKGIIIETQFQFASSMILKHDYITAYEIIVEHGGHEITSDGDGGVGSGQPLSRACPIPDEGWMYCFYDPDMVFWQDVQGILNHFFD